MKQVCSSRIIHMRFDRPRAVSCKTWDLAPPPFKMLSSKTWSIQNIMVLSHAIICGFKDRAGPIGPPRSERPENMPHNVEKLSNLDHYHYQEYTLWLRNITLHRTWYKAYFIAKLFVRKNNREVSLHVKRKRVRVTSHSGAQFRYTSRLCTLLGFASRRNVSADKQGHGHQQMPRQQPIKLVRKHNKNERTLTHWGRVTHICVDNVTIIGLHNGLSPGRRQAII